MAQNTTHDNFDVNINVNVEGARKIDPLKKSINEINKGMGALSKGVGKLNESLTKTKKSADKLGQGLSMMTLLANISFLNQFGSAITQVFVSLGKLEEGVAKATFNFGTFSDTTIQGIKGIVQTLKQENGVLQAEAIKMAMVGASMAQGNLYNARKNILEINKLSAVTGMNANMSSRAINMVGDAKTTGAIMGLSLNKAAGVRVADVFGENRNRAERGGINREESLAMILALSRAYGRPGIFKQYLEEREKGKPAVASKQLRDALVKSGYTLDEWVKKIKKSGDNFNKTFKKIDKNFESLINANTSVIDDAIQNTIGLLGKSTGSWIGAISKVIGENGIFIMTVLNLSTAIKAMTSGMFKGFSRGFSPAVLKHLNKFTRFFPLISAGVVALGLAIDYFVNRTKRAADKLAHSELINQDRILSLFGVQKSAVNEVKSKKLGEDLALSFIAKEQMDKFAFGEKIIKDSLGSYYQYSRTTPVSPYLTTGVRRENQRAYFRPDEQLAQEQVSSFFDTFANYPLDRIKEEILKRVPDADLSFLKPSMTDNNDIITDPISNEITAGGRTPNIINLNIDRLNGIENYSDNTGSDKNKEKVGDAVLQVAAKAMNSAVQLKATS